MRSMSGSPKNGGSLVTKQLDSDLLSAEPPIGKYSQVDGSSQSVDILNAIDHEKQAFKPEGFTAKLNSITLI